jgi:hypothetical protein
MFLVRYRLALPEVRNIPLCPASLGKLPSQFSPFDGNTHIGAMHLHLSDDETAALTKEVDDITRNDRCLFSERIRTLKAIHAKLRPVRARQPLPPPKVYPPPSRGGAAQRHRVAGS